MKNDKKSVLLYTEWAEPLKSLPLEEKGRIFDAILSYTESGHVPKFENPATDMAFRWIQQKLDENIQKWEETRAKRAAAGKSGGAPKGNSNAKSQNNQNNQMIVLIVLEAKKPRKSLLARRMIRQKPTGSGLNATAWSLRI